MSRRLTKSQQTRQRVLDAAAVLFRSNGYADVRLTDIATAANMQVGSLYYHFDSRESLVEELVGIGLNFSRSVMEESVADLPADATTAERLRVAMHTYAQALHGDGNFVSSAMRILLQAPDDIKQRYWRQTEALALFWDELLMKAVASGEFRDDLDIRLTRLLLTGALIRSVEWPRSERHAPEMIARTLCDMVLNGLVVRR